MKELLREIEAVAALEGVAVKDCGKGHIQLTKGKTVVNYYPLSPKVTAYDQASGQKKLYCSISDAVAMCLKPEPRQPKPRPSEEFAGLQTNPAGIKNFYQGDKPAWEFETFICSSSDRLRIAAHKLWRRAQDLEERADKEERNQTGLTALQEAARQMQIKLGIADAP